MLYIYTYKYVLMNIDINILLVVEPIPKICSTSQSQTIIPGMG